MAALPRSEISFRRSGSSGAVWDDQKHVSGELKPIKTKEDGDQEGVSHKHKRSDHDDQSKDQRKAYRTIEVTSTIDPPSPKVSGCGMCFGKPAKKTHKRKSAGRRRS